MAKASPKRKALWNKASLFGAAAIVCNLAYVDIVGGVGANPPPPREFWVKAWTLGPAFFVLWVLASSAYAQSKGYPRSLGALGLLTCVGFFLLMLLPNRWRDEPETKYTPGDYPRPNHRP